MATSYINTVDAKEEFTDLINRVTMQKEQIVLTRRGNEVAVILPVEDYNLFLELKSKQDLSEAIESLKEAREQGVKSLQDIKSKLG